MCEIGSILCFCDAFSSHIKSLSHSASLGSSRRAPLWVARMICLLHMKETGLSCFPQMFIYGGTASEKVRERRRSLSGWQLVTEVIYLAWEDCMHYIFGAIKSAIMRLQISCLRQAVTSSAVLGGSGFIVCSLASLCPGVQNMLTVVL